MGKVIFSILMGAIGIFGALYIAIWWGIVEPFLHIAELIDTNALTATAIVYELFKFIFKEFLAGVWALLFLGLAGVNVMRN